MAQVIACLLVCPAWPIRSSAVAHVAKGRRSMAHIGLQQEYDMGYLQGPAWEVHAIGLNGCRLAESRKKEY